MGAYSTVYAPYPTRLSSFSLPIQSINVREENVIMSTAIITHGYLYTVILVLALWLNLNGKQPCPIPLDDRNDISFISLNVARLLATALAIGLFLVAMPMLFGSLPTSSNIAVSTVLPSP